jgi:hypothetical protein
VSKIAGCGKPASVRPSLIPPPPPVFPKAAVGGQCAAGVAKQQGGGGGGGSRGRGPRPGSPVFLSVWFCNWYS